MRILRAHLNDIAFVVAAAAKMGKKATLLSMNAIMWQASADYPTTISRRHKAQEERKGATTTENGLKASHMLFETVFVQKLFLHFVSPHRSASVLLFVALSHFLSLRSMAMHACVYVLQYDDVVVHETQTLTYTYTVEHALVGIAFAAVDRRFNFISI